MVAAIYDKISGDSASPIYDCSDAHTLEFEIGYVVSAPLKPNRQLLTDLCDFRRGVKFPVDPRDFGFQTTPGSLSQCNVSVVATDPPSKGFLYAWSLGVPLLKS